MSDLVTFDHDSPDSSAFTADSLGDPSADPSAALYPTDPYPFDGSDIFHDTGSFDPGSFDHGTLPGADHQYDPFAPTSGDAGTDPFADWSHFGAGDVDPTIDPMGDVVHGDPIQDLQWAQLQTENGFCVPTSIAMVASEFAGHEIDAQSAVTEAEQLGYLTQDGAGNWSGLDIGQGQDLLEHLGVPCHVESGTIDTLRQYLDEGRAIVLGVNSNDIWYPDSAAAQGPIGSIDHAVVITGIDDTTGTVTLNDPGTPNGAGEQVSIADLENAWDDGGNEMIVTDGDVPGSADAGGSGNGFAMLPVVLPGTPA